MKKQEDQKQSAKNLKIGDKCPVCGRDGTEHGDADAMDKQDEAIEQPDEIKEVDEKDENLEDDDKGIDTSPSPERMYFHDIDTQDEAKSLPKKKLPNKNNIKTMIKTS